MAGMWKRTLVYLGLAEEDDDFEEYAYEEVEPESSRRQMRRASEGAPREARGGPDAVVHAMPTPQARFHLVRPNAFNDAQEIGDKFRESYSVLMDLQTADPELRQRLIDFASGLAYGLRGKIKRVADSVFLLTPEGIEVSAEERQRFLEERGFFNQA